MHPAQGFPTKHYVAIIVPQESAFQSLVWLPEGDSLAGGIPQSVPAHGVR